MAQALKDGRPALINAVAIHHPVLTRTLVIEAIRAAVTADAAGIVDFFCGKPHPILGSKDDVVDAVHRPLIRGCPTLAAANAVLAHSADLFTNRAMAESVNSLAWALIRRAERRGDEALSPAELAFFSSWLEHTGGPALREHMGRISLTPSGPGARDLLEIVRGAVGAPSSG